MLYATIPAVLLTWAYLDPGTGSYVFQLALAGILAGAVTLRVYWQRVKDLFRGHKALPPEGAQGPGVGAGGSSTPPAGNPDEKR